MEGSSLNPAPHILVVEDHCDTRNAMAKLLRFNGYQVSTAATMGEAVHAADGNNLDLVVCDLSLPDGSGVDVVREVNRRRPVPAIAVTGHSDGTGPQDADTAGFVLRLTKPVELSVLLAAIEDVTSRS